MTGREIRVGMKMTRNGKAFEVVEVLPFGQLSLGSRAAPDVTGFAPIVREWMNTKRNILAAINSGEIEISK